MYLMALKIKLCQGGVNVSVIQIDFLVYIHASRDSTSPLLSSPCLSLIYLTISSLPLDASYSLLTVCHLWLLPICLRPRPFIQLVNPAIQSLAARLDLPTLPIHFNSILYATLACFALQSASHHILSPRLFPRHYPALSPLTQFNWNTRVVAWAHAFYATGIATWILTHYDRYRSIHDEKLFGYDRQAMDFLSASAGYFLWDVIVSLKMSATGQGFGFLIHAISCFVAFTYSIKPFCGYFGFMFLLWESSTIFLNPHWFFDKVGMSGSKTQIYNGVALLAMFFLSRLVLGNYTSYQLFTLALKPGASERVGPTMVNTILILDVLLSGLNFYWFYQMIESVRKRINSSPSTRNQRQIKKKSNQKKQN